MVIIRYKSSKSDSMQELTDNVTFKRLCKDELEDGGLTLWAYDQSVSTFNTLCECKLFIVIASAHMYSYDYCI